MSLQVNIDTGTRPSPQIVAANIVVDHARSLGNPNAQNELSTNKTMFVTIKESWAVWSEQYGLIAICRAFYCWRYISKIHA